jgi:hypothetical protein
LRSSAAALSGSVSSLALSGAALPFRSAQAQDAGGDLRAHNLALAVQPKQRITCHSTEDVARAVKDLSTRNTPFSIYSSGHCFAGFSLHEEAVLDVSPMTQIAVAGEEVTVGPGVQIGPLVRALGAVGRTISAGFCQTVAMGGHLGCGGIGHLSRAHGLLADHLLRAKVVTAEGAVLSVSEAMEEDLFWALRGGGPGSFGVVTEMTFRTLEDMKATNISASLRVTPDQAARIAAAWQGWSMRLPDPVATTLTAMTPNFSNVQVTVNVVASAESPDLRRDIVAFLSAVPWDTAPKVTQGNYSDLADVFWPRDHYPSEPLAYGSAFSQGTTDVDVWASLFGQLVTQQAPRMMVFVERLGGTMARVSPEATGFAHRTEDFLWQVEGRLNRLHDPDLQAEAVDMLTARVAVTTQGGAYAGYPNPRLQGWAEAYWANNYPRLQRVKRAYDPREIFLHKQSIRPS